LFPDSLIKVGRFAAIAGGGPLISVEINTVAYEANGPVGVTEVGAAGVLAAHADVHEQRRSGIGVGVEGIRQVVKGSAGGVAVAAANPVAIAGGVGVEGAFAHHEGVGGAVD